MSRSVEYKKVVTLELTCVVETHNDTNGGAYLLTDGDNEEWIPKSQCQDNEDGTFTMPEKFAYDRGFI